MLIHKRELEDVDQVQDQPLHQRETAGDQNHEKENRRTLTEEDQAWMVKAISRAWKKFMDEDSLGLLEEDVMLQE